MFDSLKSVSSIISSKRLRMDITADNLANVNTTGFKRSRASFQDVLYQSLRDQGATQNAGGGEALTISAEKVFTQGRLEQTGNTFDLAINGSGFFGVRLPSGQTAYTRDGRLSVDGDGRLLAANGLRLLPEVTFPANARNIVIKSNGSVLAQTADNGPLQEIGNIEITRFVNPEGMVPVGQNLFVVSANSGQPIVGRPGANGLGEVLQSTLEQSNVDLATELTQALTAQRGFQSGSKLFQTVDEMLGLANNMKS